jgi:hypothetical protein
MPRDRIFEKFGPDLVEPFSRDEFDKFFAFFLPFGHVLLPAWICHRLRWSRCRYRRRSRRRCPVPRFKDGFQDMFHGGIRRSRFAVPGIKEPQKKENNKTSKENKSPSLPVPPLLDVIKKHFFFLDFYFSYIIFRRKKKS